MAELTQAFSALTIGDNEQQSPGRKIFDLSGEDKAIAHTAAISRDKHRSRNRVKSSRSEPRDIKDSKQSTQKVSGQQYVASVAVIPARRDDAVVGSESNPKWTKRSKAKVFDGNSGANRAEERSQGISQSEERERDKIRQSADDKWSLTKSERTKAQSGQSTSHHEQRPREARDNRRPSSSFDQRPNDARDRRSSSHHEQRPSEARDNRRPSSSFDQRSNDARDRRSSSHHEQRPNEARNNRRPSSSFDQRPNDARSNRSSSHYEPSDAPDRRPSSHYEPSDARYRRPSSHYEPSDARESRPSSHYEPSDARESRPSSHYEPRPNGAADSGKWVSLSESSCKEVTGRFGRPNPDESKLCFRPNNCRDRRCRMEHTAVRAECIPRMHIYCASTKCGVECQYDANNESLKQNCSRYQEFVEKTQKYKPAAPHIICWENISCSHCDRRIVMEGSEANKSVVRILKLLQCVNCKEHLHGGIGNQHGIRLH